jgi:CheY-like chemotaxis protein
VSNAVKFTEKGEVSVRISVEPNGQLVIQVADTGIGMNEEQMDRVFETFAQGDSSTTRKFGGTGLGMPIVDRLVALMSGRIDMSSRVGIGTSVRVSLPLPLARDEAKAAPVETKAITFDYEVSILAADDVSTNRAVLSALFSVHEITSDVVASGQDAVERVGSQDYDLYFLDISMPEMDGIETLRAIRARERSLGLDPVPAVAVTAHTFPNQVDGFLEDGFDAHLAKPIRSAKLVDCIQRHLNRSITRERVARRTGTEP